MKVLPTVVTAAIETAINQVLKLDPETVERIQTLQGKVIAIEFRGLDAVMYILPQAGKFNVYSHYEGEADTVLRGTPVALARMGLAKNAGDVLFEGDVEITGDVELGQQFREIIDGLDIDWEEHLSHVTGDVVAHKLGSFTRGALDWGRNTIETLGRDAAEYLQEESGDLPNRDEVEMFLTGIDDLRSDIDRLEAHVQRLSKRLQKSIEGGKGGVA